MSVPHGYHTVTTVFCVKGADDFIAFCKEALGAEECFCRRGPSDQVVHADLKLGDTIFWVTESIKDAPTCAATTYFVQDCETVFEKALGMGATPVFPPGNTPWGGRWARVLDQWGNQWTIATPIEPLRG